MAPSLASLLAPLLVLTAGALAVGPPHSTLPPMPMPLPGYSSCTCREFLPPEGGSVEVQCSCESAGTVMVQQDVHSLTISDLKQPVLDAETLIPHGNSLRDLFLTNTGELQIIRGDVLRGLLHLRTLDISDAPKLTSLPDALLQGVSPVFRTLRVVRTALQEVPRLNSASHILLHMVDLESNHIRTLRSNNFRVKSELLILNYNAIERVENFAFNGSHVAKLSLRGNRQLATVAENAFAGLHSLHHLDLSDTAITQLPTRGLDTLEVLRIQNTPGLTVIPSIHYYKFLREAWLTYSFHCCAFHYPERHDPIRHKLQQEYEAAARRRCRQNLSTTTPAPARVATPPFGDVLVGGPRVRRSSNANSYDDWLNGDYMADAVPGGPDSEDISAFSSEDEDFGNERGDDAWDDNLEDGGGAEWSNEEDEWNGVFHHTTVRPRRRHHALCGNMSYRRVVICRPEPDALNPCEDIMGSTWLRASVWLVLVTAVVGNSAVLLGLLAAPHHMSPGKFLMCNLAFADLCMGLYLLLLASADAHSHGAYFNFAYTWQRGAGCKAAGFLTVFASQLSVYTLALLTLERWVAITYALYLNKRLKLRACMFIMLAGWVYSIIMASLPLAGVSSYSTTSICLPMETAQPRDVVYLTGLLSASTLAFVVVCVCYARIYLSLGHDTRGSALRRGEMTVAKRMALLVFTDFACWAPISFFAFTAVVGYPLIDVTRSKILLVFFYPLNSCANPYLYALLTKQYRRDLVSLLVRHGLWRRNVQHAKGAYSSPTTNQSQPQQVAGRQNETTTATGAASAAATGNEEASV